jgi:hypothetical protein
MLIGLKGDARVMSKMIAELKDEIRHKKKADDIKHTIQIAKEMICDPSTSEADRGLWQRVWAARDPNAPKPPDHPLIAAFKKHNR